MISEANGLYEYMYAGDTYLRPTVSAVTVNNSWATICE